MIQYGLSKSRIAAYRQCPKRLWLEVHRPDAATVSSATQSLFTVGHTVGETARQLRPGGVLIDSQGNLRRAMAETSRHISAETRLLFEPAFEFDGVLVRIDILERAANGYELREVKASGSVKDYHVPDVAIQAWVLQNAGLRLDSALIQHIDTGFVYPGRGDYRRLFTETAVDAEIHPLTEEVPRWVAGAKETLGGREPERKTGKHCYQPFVCPCLAYCAAREPSYDFPLTC